nr:60S ribosomal protein L22-like 1 [Desmodus rotundus]
MVPKVKNIKRTILKFGLDLVHPVENGICYSGNFEQFLPEKIKVSGVTGDLGNVVYIESSIQKNKITVVSEKQFSKRYLKYHTKKYLRKNSLHDWFCVVASNEETYKFCFLPNYSR